MEVCVEPTLTISTQNEVVCLEFAPYEWCKNLLAVALPNVLNIYSVKLQESAECSLLCSSQLEGECCALSWSPYTSLTSSPQNFKLMLATAGDAILEFSTDLKTSKLREVFRHNSCINSLAFSGISSLMPTLCASVGDDQLLRVWQETEDCSSTALAETIMLMDPGQSVRFHPEDASLLLVCEVSGTLRLYRVCDSPGIVLTAELSVRCPSPALDADWSLSEPSLLFAAGPAGVMVITLDATGSAQKRLRQVSGTGSETGGSSVVAVRAARNTAALVAAVTPANSVNVLHTSANRIPLAAHLKSVSGLSWHLGLPYLAVGSDRKVMLWRIDHV